MAGTCSMLCLIIVTLFIPPLGVFMIAGCGVDFWINLLPGPYSCILPRIRLLSTSQPRPLTRASQRPAPGVYSERIQNGGHSRSDAPRNYGTI
ncbi:Proteolipid membrane potential modulator [Penicillium cinerascens]|uniref:Proteolipid membrane potential modulator n=1 Tax=Penicillium cinerascens TaxID=70096 RepID=A0A9W9J8N3_9EURO|nr:Proteolipid membrane potential modulator [Penicillium cinerascens]KAJ5191577.1 Proteolipid membrane potential modulator [Penicillium cinerascens]